MLGRKDVQFGKLLDKATSNLLLEPDWNLNMQICDLIRQKDVQSKHAVTSIRKKLKSENPHVLYFTLLVLESCMKNCGPPFHEEVATKSFMTELHGILQVSTAEKVRTKILELIQTWESAFRSEPKYRAIGDLLAIVKMEGYKLPDRIESEKMYKAGVAPPTVDTDYCYRCRVNFSLLQRKSPCTNCGYVFCNQCTSHRMFLPHYGIERQVAVCETCWQKLRKPPLPPKPPSFIQRHAAAQPKSTLKQISTDLKKEYVQAKNEAVLKAQETDKELKLAIELSIQEEEMKKAELKESEKELQRAVELSKKGQEKEKAKQKSRKSANDYRFHNPELMHYLDRNYWEKKRQTIPTEKVDPPSTCKQQTNIITTKNSQVMDKLNTFSGQLKKTLEGFVNRLETNVSRGRSNINDTYVQSLFGKISSMNFQLISYLEELNGIRAYYESLQDKIYQFQDGIAAFRALKNEFSERQMQLAKKEKFLRDIQLAQKVREVRKQKQELLQAEARKTLFQLQKTKAEMLNKTDEVSTDINSPNTAFVAPEQSTSMQPSCPSYPYNPFFSDNVETVFLPQASEQDIHDAAISDVERIPPPRTSSPENSFPDYQAPTTSLFKSPGSLRRRSSKKQSNLKTQKANFK